MDIKKLLTKQQNHSKWAHNIFYLTVFIIAGILGRYILVGWNIQPFPNFEIIMILTFLAALIMKPYLAFLVPLFSMIGSDFLLGNPLFAGSQMNKIIIFTYSGFILIALLSVLTRKQTFPHLRGIRLKHIALSTGIGIGFALMYDLWTNIGWWYLMYPHNPESLIAVLAAGIPFMIYHLLSASVTFTLIGLPLLNIKSWKKQLCFPKPLPRNQKITYITIAFLCIVFSVALLVS